MASHPWMAPSDALVTKVARARAKQALRELPALAPHCLGPRAPAWPRLLGALPALLRADAPRLLDAVARIDVLSVLLELPDGAVDGSRLERALVTLWLAVAGHPGLDSPLALPGPFGEPVVDPWAPRLLAFGGARGLIATARGPVVVGSAGRVPIDRFVVAALPAVDGIVIVDGHLGAPDAAVVERARAALQLVRPTLPGGRLERVTIGPGDSAAGAAAFGEARVGADVDPADLVASAQAAFIRAAAALEPTAGPGGVLVVQGRRLSPTDVLARAGGNAAALPWRTDHAAAATGIIADLDDLVVLADLTPAGAEVAAAVRALAGGVAAERRRALLVNVDADDFVYSFQFGRSVERRCVERGQCVDRITIATGEKRDLTAELGQPPPPPVADGIEITVDSENDPSLVAVLPRLCSRHYEVVVTNVRPRLFYDLLAAGLLATPTLVWDRHLHDGLGEERARRGPDADQVRALPIRVWSLLGISGPALSLDLVNAGFECGSSHAWPMDLEFFQSTQTCQPDRVFAGGDSARDWPLFVEAVRGLPLDVHLVTAHPPPDLPARVHVEARLPLWEFRDAMASSSICAIPLARDIAAGVTVLPMAMALGTAVVATHTSWIAQYVTDGEEALLVPAGDAGAFGDALVRLHADAALRARLVANARRRVATLCDLEAFTREMFASLG